MSNRSLCLLTLVFITVTLGFSGCGKKQESKPPVPQAQQFAISLLNARFSEHEGRWLALEQRSGKQAPRLVELNKPTMSLDPQSVSETDRMNGVSERHSFSIFCEQYRQWDGTWSEWKDGTGGGGTKLLVHAMTGGTLGYQHYQIEKKNGVWSVKFSKPPILVENRSLLQQTVATAFSGQR